MNICRFCGCTESQARADARVLGLNEEFESGLHSCCQLVAWADDFTRIGPLMLVVLAIVTAVGLIADNIAGIWGARLGGASKWGVLGAALGALAGLPFGLPGLILGAPVGAMILEYVKNPELSRAARAGVGSLAGFLLGILAKYVFGVLIVAIAALAYFF